MINLSTSNELKLYLDPVDAEDHVPSVAFNIKVEFSMPFQSINIEDRERWISVDSLDAFEHELSALSKQDNGEVILKDLSERMVIQVARNGNRIKTRISAGDTLGMGRVSLEVSGYSSEIQELVQRLRDYPKWW